MAIVRVNYPVAVGLDVDDSSPAVANAETIQANMTAHVPANITYLAVAVPSVAQTTAQLAALTRAVNALIYLATQQYGSTSGT